MGPRSGSPRSTPRPEPEINAARGRGQSSASQLSTAVLSAVFSESAWSAVSSMGFGMLSGRGNELSSARDPSVAVARMTMSELDDQIQIRRTKRGRLAAAGIDAYPPRFLGSLEPTKVHELYDGRIAEELDAAAIRLPVAGRVPPTPPPATTPFPHL